MKFTIFQGTNGQWYWAAGPARGGRQVACGGEGFKTRSSARRAAWNVVKRIRADVVNVDGVKG